MAVKTVKRIVAAAMMAAGVFSASAETWTWTGEGGNSNWTNPLNWDRETGYPDARDAEVVVSKSATITLDTGCETKLKYFTATGSGVVVTLNGTADSVLNFTYIASTDYVGLNVLEGAQLYVYADISTGGDEEFVSSGKKNGRIDHDCDDGGAVHFLGNYRSVTGGYNYMAGNGDWYFEGDSFTYISNNVAFGHKSGNQLAYTVDVLVKDNAVVTNGGSFILGSNSTPPNTVVTQEGEGTRVAVQQLYVGGNSASYKANPTNCYCLKSGSLTIADTLGIAYGMDGKYIQEGGEATATKLLIANLAYVAGCNQDVQGAFEMYGGSFRFRKINYETDNGRLDCGKVVLKDCAFSSDGVYANDVPWETTLGGVVALGTSAINDNGKIVSRELNFLKAILEPEIALNLTSPETDLVTLGVYQDYELTEGNSIEVTKLVVGSSDAKVDFTLNGGDLTVKELECGDYGVFTFAGGTLHFLDTASPKALIKVTGAVNVEVPAGKTVTLNVELGEGGQICETGEGTLIVNYGGKSYFTVGEYEFSTLTVGAVDWSELVIDGAEITVGTLAFGSAEPTSGGKLTLKSGSLAITSGIKEVASGRSAIEFAGGTFKTLVDLSLTNEVTIAEGDAQVVSFEVDAGKTLTFAKAPEFVGYPLLIKTGAGTLYFGDGTVVDWRGNISVESGFVQLGNYTTLRQPAGDTSGHQINIGAGACFCIGNGKQAAVNAWVDYWLNAENEVSGYIFAYERNTIPINSVTLADGTCIDTPFTYPGTGKNGTKHTDAGTDWFRQGGGAENTQLVIPYRWTGAGDDDNYHNPANWENETVPPAPAPSANPKLFVFADISAADHISFAGANINISGFVVLPTDGVPKKVVIEGPATGNDKVAFSAASYGSGTFVGMGNELVYRNCQLYRSSGTPICRSFGGKVTLEGNRTFGFSLKSGGGYWGCDVVARCGTNTMTEVELSFAGYAEQYSSFWFDEGSDVTFQCLYTGQNSIPNMPTYGVRNGGKLTLESLYVNRISGDNLTTFYLQGEDSELTLTEGLYLGTKKVFKDLYRAYSGGSFNMEGGTLRTAGIQNELMNNACYLKDGEVYLGAGGITRSYSREERPHKDDHTIVQTTPAVFLQGATVHATAAFENSLKTEFTDFTTSVIDTDEYEVTFSGELTGAGTIVKRGAGALVLNGLANTTAKLEIEAGSLKLGANYSGVAMLRRLTVPSANSVALTAGQTLTVGEFFVDGVAQSGTVNCGDGTVVVSTSTYDWVIAADTTAQYTQTFTANAEIGSFAYDCVASEAGVLTITGQNGAQLTLPANTTIFVAEGDTLVIDLPVYMAGRVDFSGGGEVLFTTKATVTSVAKHWTVLNDGTYITLSTPWASDGSIAINTSTQAKRLGRITVEGAGYLNQNPFPFNGASSGAVGVGGEMVLKGGGKFRLRATDGQFGPQANTKQTHRVILEAGGILVIPGKLYDKKSNLSSTLEIISYGGTISSDSEPRDVGPKIAGDLTVTLMDNEVLTLNTYAGDTKPTVFNNDFVGEGKLYHAVNQRLCLGGSLAGVTEIDCQAGSLTLDAKPAATIPATADLKLGAGVKVTLNFNGIMTINNWYVEGEELPYNKVYTIDDPVYGKYLKGPGKLKVTGNPRPGMVIIVK